MVKRKGLRLLIFSAFLSLLFFLIMQASLFLVYKESWFWVSLIASFIFLFMSILLFYKYRWSEILHLEPESRKLSDVVQRLPEQ